MFKPFAYLFESISYFEVVLKVWNVLIPDVAQVWNVIWIGLKS